MPLHFTPIHLQFIQYKAKLAAISDENKTLREQNAKLHSEKQSLKAQLSVTNESNRKLQSELRELNVKLEAFKEDSSEAWDMLSYVEDVLVKKWDDDQIRLFFGQIKKVPVYSYKALARAASLRIIGNSKFSFVRKLENLPIPSNSTVIRFMKKLDFRAGVILLSMNMLHVKLDLSSDEEKHLGIFVDEIPLCGLYRFNEDTGRIEGANASYVIKVASLKGTFSQTIFFDFYFPSAEQLREIFTMINKIGGFPRLMSSDSFSKNLKTYDSLIAYSYDESYWHNRKEMLKNVPNWFFYSNDEKPDNMITQNDVDNQDEELLHRVMPELRNNIRIYINLDQCHNLRVLLEHLRKNNVFTIEGIDFSIDPLVFIATNRPPGCHVTIADLGTSNLQNMKSALRVVSYETAQLLEEFAFTNPVIKEQALKLAKLFRYFFYSFNI